MPSQLFDDVLARKATKEAFRTITDCIPPDSPKQDDIIGVLTRFAERFVEIAAAADLPSSTSRGVPVLWKRTAEECLEASQFDVGGFIRKQRGELRMLGMPFGLLLQELAVTVTSEALLLRSAGRG